MIQALTNAQYLPFFSTKYIKIKTILIFSTIQKTKSNTYV